MRSPVRLKAAFVTAASCLKTLHLMMRQQGLVEGGLRFNDIRSRDRRRVRRQRLERQQDCGLSIASRRGLLRKKRKRKGLGAQSLIAGLEGFRSRADSGLVSVYLRQCRVPSSLPAVL